MVLQVLKLLKPEIMQIQPILLSIHKLLILIHKLVAMLHQLILLIFRLFKDAIVYNFKLIKDKIYHVEIIITVN